MTIHKSQRLSLDKVWINLGKSEPSTGLSCVVHSQKTNLESILMKQ